MTPQNLPWRRRAPANRVSQCTPQATPTHSLNPINPLFRKKNMVRSGPRVVIGMPASGNFHAGCRVRSTDRVLISETGNSVGMATQVAGGDRFTLTTARRATRSPFVDHPGDDHEHFYRYHWP